MQYDKGKHCVFYHRYHLVWSTKYRYKVLLGDVRRRVRDIIRQVCAERDVDIISGVLSSDHVHMFVSVPPKLAVSDLILLMKGRSSHKVQREFPHLKKRYWGRHFWGRGYFSTTNGAITEDFVLQYLENHIGHGFVLSQTICRRSARYFGNVSSPSARSRVTKFSSPNSDFRPWTTSSSRCWACSAFSTMLCWRATSF